MTDNTTLKPSFAAPAGTLGFVLGGGALILVLVTFVAGPFAPQQTVGTSLGEIAAEAGKAGLRNLLGLEQPAPTAAPWTIDRILWATGVFIGACAVLCGSTALIRRERRDVATWAIGLGVAAISIQVLASAMMIILGVLIVCALIYALGDFLSFG